MSLDPPVGFVHRTSAWAKSWEVV